MRLNQYCALGWAKSFCNTIEFKAVVRRTSSEDRFCPEPTQAGLKSRSAAVLVLPFRSDTPEGPTVHHRADGRPDILHGAIVGDGRETWQSRLSGSGRFRLPGCIP